MKIAGLGSVMASIFFFLCQKPYFLLFKNRDVSIDVSLAIWFDLWQPPFYSGCERTAICHLRAWSNNKGLHSWTCIVAFLLAKSWIDDINDPIYGQRGLCNVGSYDDLWGGEKIKVSKKFTFLAVCPPFCFPFLIYTTFLAPGGVGSKILACMSDGKLAYIGRTSISAIFEPSRRHRSCNISTHASISSWRKTAIKYLGKNLMSSNESAE